MSPEFRVISLYFSENIYIGAVCLRLCLNRLKLKSESAGAPAPKRIVNYEGAVIFEREKRGTRLCTAGCYFNLQIQLDFGYDNQLSASSCKADHYLVIGENKVWTYMSESV